MHIGITYFKVKSVTFRIISGSQTHYTMKKANSSLDAQITWSLSAYKLSTYLNMKLFIFVVPKMDILQHKTVKRKF